MLSLVGAWACDHMVQCTLYDRLVGGYGVKMISVMSLKGGSGKSTTLINLATYAEHHGCPSLILDLDPLSACVQWGSVRESCSIDRGPKAAQGSAVLLPSMIETARRQSGVQVLWVDTPAHAEGTAHASVSVSDLVLITCRPSLLDIQTLYHTARLCNGTPAGVVLTQCPPRGKVVEEAQEFIREAGMTLAPTLGSRVDFAKSINEGKGIYEFAPRSKAAGEIANLWQWVEKHLLACDLEHENIDESISFAG